MKAKARQRLEEAADRMAKELLGIATTSQSETVKLAAIRDALDRAGISAKQALELSTAPMKPYEELLDSLSGVAHISRAESRAARGLASEAPALAAPADDIEILDAELVPEPGDDPAHSPAHGLIPAEPPEVAPTDSASPTGPPSGPPGRGLMTLEDAAAEANRGTPRQLYPRRRAR